MPRVILLLRKTHLRWALTGMLPLLLLLILADIASAPLNQEELGPLSNLKIVIDPGHGGVDGGCGNDGVLEKTINLEVATALDAKLREKGALVKLTRTTDEALVPWGSPGGSRHRRDLEARVKTAQDFPAQLYLALHVNSGPSSLGGSLTFYRKRDEESKRLASAVQERLTEVVPGNQNGILPASFMVLTSLSVPAILIEMGFLSHPADKGKLTGPGAADALASAITAGIESFVSGDAPAKPVISPYPVPLGDDPHDPTTPPSSSCLLNLEE